MSHQFFQHQNIYVQIFSYPKILIFSQIDFRYSLFNKKMLKERDYRIYFGTKAQDARNDRIHFKERFFFRVRDCN